MYHVTGAYAKLPLHTITCAHLSVHFAVNLKSPMFNQQNGSTSASNVNLISDLTDLISPGDPLLVKFLFYTWN